MRARIEDFGLRIGGGAAAYAAWTAITALRRLAEDHPARLHGPLAFTLAAIAFLLASGGAVLIVLGRHIFDSVAISPRWRQVDLNRPQSGDSPPPAR